MFAFFAGWGKVAFPGTFNNGTGFQFSNYFWLPIVAPLVGGVIGAVVYDFFIGDVLHARKSRTALEAPREPGRAEPNVVPDRV
jgi:glycerol uptake facilitator protein